MSAKRGVLLAGLLLAPLCWAQRPDESVLFGAPDAGVRRTPRPSSDPLLRGLPPPGVKPGASTGSQSRPDDELMFGPPAPDAGVSRTPAETLEPEESRRLEATSSPDAFASGAVKEDPLKIGGLFYLRGFVGVSQDQPFNRSRVSLPTLVDVYLDARPTDQLRAFVLGRMTYDPFLSATVGATPLPGLPASTSVSNPAVFLDQAWLAFDIARAVFVTAGRQHVKWGVGHFFSPTDFLASQPRDPLALFDARLGVTMLRAQIPWERAGWNFTAVALFEPTQNVGGGYSGTSGVENPSSSGVNPSSAGTELRDVGGAFRAEFAFKNGAFGIDGLAQRNRKSRVGGDLTMSLGDIDFYAEVAIKDGLDTPTEATLNLTTQTPVPNIPGVSIPPGSTITTTLPLRFTAPGASTPVVQAVGGLTYSINFEGNRSITLGGEYFFNSAGFERDDYLHLLLVGAFQPFYVGKHYLALSAALLDTTARTTWVLTGIGNLSDSSYIARIDFVVTVLSWLSVESYVAGHFGRTGGEFRLGFPVQTLGALVTPPDPSLTQTFGPINAPILDFGIGLRMSI
jgi:hypothetical protein